MTPYEPRHKKTYLGTDHLIFWGAGGAGFFHQDFLPIEKQRFFFSHSPRAKIFFSGQSKNIVFFFSKQHICSKCILLDLYVRVFLEPNIHGYIVCMFVYTCILDIWVRVYMSRDMTKPTKWLSAQSDQSSLSAWRSIGSLATHWAHGEDSDQTGRMPRLIWVFAGRTLILLALSCRGSYVHIKTFFNFSYPATIYPLMLFILHRVVFTIFWYKLQGKICEWEVFPRSQKHIFSLNASF